MPPEEIAEEEKTMTAQEAEAALSEALQAPREETSTSDQTAPE